MLFPKNSAAYHTAELLEWAYNMHNTMLLPVGNQGHTIVVVPDLKYTLAYCVSSRAKLTGRPGKSYYPFIATDKESKRSALEAAWNDFVFRQGEDSTMLESLRDVERHISCECAIGCIEQRLNHNS